MDFTKLSGEQQEFIRCALNGENVLTDACIGSGKTTTIQVLCDMMDSDKTILYLTYNTLLKVDAKEKIKNRNVKVHNYHGLAYYALAQAGIATSSADAVSLYNRKRPALPFTPDVLIIDEYQDIDTEIATFLKYIKETNPSMQILAVGDIKQKLYDKTTLDSFGFIRDFLGNYTEIPFSICFRLNNELASKLGKIWDKQIVGVNDDCTFYQMKSDKLVEYLGKQNPGDVLCLGKVKGRMASVLNALEEKYPDKYNKNTVYAKIFDGQERAVKPDSTTAIFTTFDGSKGLERPICVIFDFTKEYWNVRSNMPNVNVEILRNIFCVASSRGKGEIIFVDNVNLITGLSMEHILDLDKDLNVLTSNKMGYTDFIVSEMCDFKYMEDVIDTYNMLEIEDLTPRDRSVININTKDGLIDLSPCVGIYPSAKYFRKYDIQAVIEATRDAHHKKSFHFEPDKGKTLEEHILYCVYCSTLQNRYIKQAKKSYISEEESELIEKRLATVFTRDEEVEKPLSLSFMDNEWYKRKTADGTSSVRDHVINGFADVVKDDCIYELKFVEELSKTHFIQTAAYMVMSGLPTGILWNIRDNTRKLITIPDRKAFVRQLIKTISKGLYKDVSFNLPACDDNVNMKKAEILSIKAGANRKVRRSVADLIVNM